MAMIIRSIPDVVVDFDEMAEAFASGFSSEQVFFLQAFAKEVNRRMDAGRWPMQCRYITDEAGWDEHTRKELIYQLEVLVDHLKDPNPANQ